MIFNEQRRKLRGLSHKTTERTKQKGFYGTSGAKMCKEFIGGGSTGGGFGRWEMGEERVGIGSSKRVGRAEIRGHYAAMLTICSQKIVKWRYPRKKGQTN